MIGLCTDSNSLLPVELQHRFDVEIVPVTVTVDGVEYLERTELDDDTYYGFFADGARPEVSTSQPSPGQFAMAYEALVDRGCTEILSLHVNSAVSGTLNSARLGAKAIPVPIRLVDTGTASFGVSCCVWAAGEAIAAGATLEQAAAAAEALAPTIGNAFIIGLDDYLRRSGRAGDLDAGATDVPTLPVLALEDGKVVVVDRVQTVADAVTVMARRAIRWADQVNVAVGVADATTFAIGDALADAIGESANVRELVRYRVGPSVAANSGPDAVGVFMFPANPPQP